MKHKKHFLLLATAAMLAAGSVAANNDLPVIRIDTKNGAAISSKTAYVPINFTLEDPNNSRYNITATTEFTDSIKGRGNSTWDYAKKPYRIKFNKKTSVFGLREAKSWVLLAEYRDPTDLINATAFQLGRVFDMPYTNTYQHVHVYLNGNYHGVYGFTEHRQADPDNTGAPGRVKIDENNGGWFVSVCTGIWDEEPKFKTSPYNVGIMIKAPEDENNATMNNQRFHYVRDDWNNLAAKMAAHDFPENGYRDLIDMRSFIDFIMTSEIVHNLELKPLRGRYAYKESASSPIRMGPLWDFDYAYGIDDPQPHYRHIFFLDQYVSGLVPKEDFLMRLFQDPVFASKYKDRWNEKYQDILAVTNWTRSLGERIRSAMAQDAERWNIQDQGQGGGPGGGWGGGWNNPPQLGYNYSTFNPNHAEETEKLISWWNKRCAWLNTEINQIQSLPTSVAVTAAKKSARPNISVRGRMLSVSSPNNSALAVRMIDVRGKTVARFNARTTGDGRSDTFSLTNIPAGKYFVDVKGAGVRQTLPVVVK